MSDISSALSVAQRLIHLLDHLGLHRAHFALRYPLDLVGLLEHAPERIASVALQGAICLDNHAPEEQNTATVSKQRAALFVKRSCQQWIVQDPEGNFWRLPAVDNPWDHRQPFHPTAVELEPVPDITHSCSASPFEPKKRCPMARQTRLEEAQGAEGTLEDVGTIPERAPVGDGPGGLQRRGGRLETDYGDLI